MNNESSVHLPTIQPLPVAIFRNRLSQPSPLKLRRACNDVRSIKVRHYEECERRGNPCMPWIQVCFRGNGNPERLLLRSSLKGQ